MPQVHSGETTRFRNFLISHRRLSLIFILVAIAMVVMTPAVVIASRLVYDAVPGTHGNTTRLINNWTITPAGLETRLGDLPMNSVLSPDGNDLLVSNCACQTIILQARLQVLLPRRHLLRKTIRPSAMLYKPSVIVSTGPAQPSSSLRMTRRTDQITWTLTALSRW